MVMVNENNFILCPLCGKKTKTKLREDTVLKNFPLYCTWCKKEIIISTEQEASSD